MKDIALAYAGAGWPVLWVYGMHQENGEWVCNCGSLPPSKVCTPKSSSRGKHPPFGGHGAHDATTDPATIASWPWQDGPNIGIAGRDSCPIIDIDDPDITAKLLDPNFGLRDIATASTTGRGVHIYMQCAPTGNGNIKNKVTGERIGEIRGHGNYVVAPPSTHWTGRNYAWVGGSILEQGPTITDKDAWTWLADLLRPMGIEILPKREAGANPSREEIIDGVTELPYQTANATLIATINGAQMFMGSTDRSGDLFKLACDLIRDTRSIGATPTMYALAGVLKGTDIRRGAFHHKGAKYAFRNNADEMYWDMIHEAAREVDKEQVAAAAVVKPTNTTGGDDDLLTVTTTQSYFYQEEPSAFLNGTNPKKPVKIANFEPRIIEEVTSWAGDDDDAPTEKLWFVDLRMGDETIKIKLSNESYKETRTLLAAIQKEIPSHFVISDGQGGQFAQGIREYSGVVPKRRALALSGWVPNRDAFLLPGGPGAITRDGFDVTTRYETLEPNARFQQYGWGVVPQDGADLATVARALFNLREPHIMVPLLNQVFGAPMTSLGVGKVPIVAHLFARTGSYKSTIARIAVSVFGRFTNVHTDQVDEWKSTPTSLQKTMYRTRDLPLIMDDFKLIGFSQHDMNERVSLIQHYADRTGKTRSSRTQREQEHLIPRCLLVSTGEDVWNGQESAVARTLVIDASLSEDRQKIDELKHRMTRLQDMANDGLLGALGYEWLHWLVSRGRTQLTEEIDERYLAKREGMAKSALADQHPRVAASVAMLLAVGSIFMEFLKERIPDVYEEYQELSREGWGRTIHTAAEKAEESKGLSPYYQLVNAILSSLATGEVYLQQRTKMAEPVGIAGADVVGFVDEDAVWLNENVTLGWYRVQQRRQGLDCHIGWPSFLQEAKRDHNGTATRHPTPIYGTTAQRMVRIPKHDFFGEQVFEEIVTGMVSSV